jgi:hypothetical protein
MVKSTANHIIHKQTLDIQFRDFTTLHSWTAANQAKSAEAVRRSIEQCLKNYDAVHEYLTIETLELDLGVFSAGQLSGEMPERLSQQLQKILSAQHAGMDNAENGAGKRMPLVKNSEVAAFLFFLQHGRLPWWYPNEPAWDEAWLQELTAENWQELLNFLMAHQENEVRYEHTRSRLIAQFNDGFLARLLNGLQEKEAVEKAWNLFTRFYDAAGNENALPPFSDLRRRFWQGWIGYASGRSAIPEMATLFVDAESGKFKQPEQADQVAEDDFIAIPGAGLVLLHPFLPRLFEYCHWLKENEFVNDETRNHAVYALHYLAAGDEEAPEYVLMLPKLLCGIPLESPLESVLPLTDPEKEACDDMLRQVIAHWAALRNTSPAGLRETFLRRQGKLFSTDEGWRLEVQRKTEDILLNRLPWGFSIIKFPWMPRLLSVSWQ